MLDSGFVVVDLSAGSARVHSFPGKLNLRVQHCGLGSNGGSAPMESGSRSLGLLFISS
jgi:hypothetical protein